MYITCSTQQAFQLGGCQGLLMWMIVVKGDEPEDCIGKRCSSL